MCIHTLIKNTLLLKNVDRHLTTRGSINLQFVEKKKIQYLQSTIIKLCIIQQGMPVYFNKLLEEKKVQIIKQFII